MFEQPQVAPPSIRSVATIREDIDYLKPVIVTIKALLTMEDATRHAISEETLNHLQNDLKKNESKMAELEAELATLEKPETVSTPA